MKTGSRYPYRHQDTHLGVYFGEKVVFYMTINAAIASLPVEARALLAIAILWLAGFLMSRVTKIFSLPNVTGYILAGIAIGPYCLNLIPSDLSAHMAFVTDAALAFIAFSAGRYIRLDILRDQGKKVILLTLFEALAVVLLVTLVMMTVFHLPLAFSLMLGAIGSATAPASSLMTIRQYHAKGPFVNTLIQVIALDDAVALLAFSISAAVASSTQAMDQGWQEMLIPVLQNLGVLLVSYILGRLLCFALRGRSPDHRIILTCAFLFALAGGCAVMNVSPLLGCLVLGATYTNCTDDKTLFKQVNRIAPPINMLFFVLSGMMLNVSTLQTAALIGIGYCVARFLGKYLGSCLGCRIIHAPAEVQKYLGLALIPQAGISIGLAVLAQRMLPAPTGALIYTVILCSSVLFEMIGPMSTKHALIKSGAIRPDALSSGTPKLKTNAAKKAATLEANKTLLGTHGPLTSSSPVPLQIPSRPDLKKKASGEELSKKKKKAAKEGKHSDKKGRSEKAKAEKEKKKTPPEDPVMIPPIPSPPVEKKHHLFLSRNGEDPNPHYP